jgi:hypothetical protein
MLPQRQPLLLLLPQPLVEPAPQLLWPVLLQLLLHYFAHVLPLLMILLLLFCCTAP